MIKVCLLGTGNAAGFPLYGCNCEYCSKALENPELKRTPCSALIEIGEKKYLIDAGQMNLHERFPAGTIDGILLTHFHPDHVQGLFHLRWGKGLEIPVYCPPDSVGCADLYKHPGILQFNSLRKFEAFSLEENLRVTPLPLIHSKPTFGYLFECDSKSIAYLTDTKGLPPGTLEHLKSVPLETLIIDCSYMPGDDSKGHNNLDDVFDIQQEVSANIVILTHIGHDFDVWLNQNPDALPDNIIVGRDGMAI